jgi:hypothetical protein
LDRHFKDKSGCFNSVDLTGAGRGPLSC